MAKKAVILLSGGLDSATNLGIASTEGFECYPLSFNYGQRHSRELDQARKLAQYYKVADHAIVPLQLGSLLRSALTDDSVHLPEGREPEAMQDIPDSYVPARNTIMLSISLAYAETIGAGHIFIGVNALDYSGYPDCRPEYIEAFQHLANLATKRAVQGEPVEIVTPLLHLTKAEIIIKGMALEVPYHLTSSCYNGGEKACGVCDSCVLRLKGFKEAGFEDPVEYE
jgi:7-cyano-7-deazaguanine synthase